MLDRYRRDGDVVHRRVQVHPPALQTEMRRSEVVIEGQQLFQGRRRHLLGARGPMLDVAEAAGTTVVMEANPPEYGADFITRAGDAIELVHLVSHPGFRLHLDTGCMTLANDPVRDTWIWVAGWTIAFLLVVFGNNERAARAGAAPEAAWLRGAHGAAAL